MDKTASEVLQAWSQKHSGETKYFPTKEDEDGVTFTDVVTDIHYQDEVTLAWSAGGSIYISLFDGVKEVTPEELFNLTPSDIAEG